MIRACSSTPAVLISTQRCAEKSKSRDGARPLLGSVFHPAVKFLGDFKQQISADGALIEVGAEKPTTRSGAGKLG